MSIPDVLTEKYLRLVSGLAAHEVASVLATKPRDAKAALARQLVKRLHGEAAAARAEADFDRRFRQREVPSEIEEREVHIANVESALVNLGLARSRNEA